jgi:hypothetical protein
MRPQTFKLDEFCTGAWSDRPEYNSEDIEFDHVLGVHKELGSFVGWYPIGDQASPDFGLFLHQETEVHFEFYLYFMDSFSLYPVMRIYGTTFDGVRESSGCPHCTTDLLELAAALQWVHAFACERWAGYKEWYA